MIREYFKKNRGQRSLNAKKVEDNDCFRCPRFKIEDNENRFVVLIVVLIVVLVVVLIVVLIGSLSS